MHTTQYPEEKRVQEVLRFLHARAHVSFSASLEPLLPKEDYNRSVVEVIEIESRLKRGDFSAWFCALCTAEWMGVSAQAAKGQCSFSSFRAFEMSLEYERLREEALILLATKIAAIESILRDQVPTELSPRKERIDARIRSIMSAVEI